MTAILGISAFYHDSAAALIVDGEVVSAVQEERFTRKKHDSNFPSSAIEYILQNSGLKLNQVEHVAFYDKPFLKFERLLETSVAFAPKGLKQFSLAMPIWLREKLFLKKRLINFLTMHDKEFDKNKLLFSEHHMSHAASAFYPSPFNDAVVLTLDGVGEWATSSVAIGKGNKLKIEKEIHFPHSLGLLYSAFTYYLGFKVNSGEYKVMGLAPYGEPKFKNIILDKLIDLKEDGSFWLNQSYFNYATGLTMTNQKFSDLFCEPVRKPESNQLTQFHMDIAASVQAVTEEIVIKMTRSLAANYSIPNLCLAGGVALNCVANGKILRDQSFKNIWIQPAAGDAGGALGSAFSVWHQEMEKNRRVNLTDSMKGAYLGPCFSQSEIEKKLDSCGAVFETFSQSEILEKTTSALTEGKAIGWFQGRMEFGPRSLGSRSILADPRSESMQKTLNLKIKFRESFRPFAPAVLREDMHEWFNLDIDSPYMLIVDFIKKSKYCEVSDENKLMFGIDNLNIKRSIIPAVTHVDYSARIQTVHKKTNPKFHALISMFKKETGCSVLVNTSFNVRGEPIVCTPKDAYNCFMGTGLEVLVIEDTILFKDKQSQNRLINYKNRYSLD
jgi:carbamoyltransferase